MSDSSTSEQPTPRRPTSRAQAREHTQQRILELGRTHLATYGAAGLSLRAIARDLDLVSSAVYRYVASRDDLLTLLVVDAYVELADRVVAAHATAPAGDARRQLTLSCRAFRDWAVAEPSRYALLYGSPVPGYQAPAEQTTEPGTRVVGLLVRTVAAAGEQIVFPPREPTAAVVDFSSITTEFGAQMSDDAMHAAIALWSTTVGLTSLEVFGQYGTEPPFDLTALFTLQIDGLLDRIGLPASR